jgi:c-di-GMP-binding flagellar brake protein YcgR
MVDSTHETKRDLAIHDNVLVEADVAGRPASFSTVLLKVCPTELWLGLASPDRRLDAIRLGRAVGLSVARPGAALVGTSEFLRAMGGSRSRVFAVRRPESLNLIQRRAHPRYVVDLPVRFRHIDSATWQPRGKSNAGTTVNLSPGGMLLRTDASVDVGEKLDVMLPLSVGNRISTTDRVIRVGPRLGAPSDDPAHPQVVEVAVEFTRITAIDQEWIVRYALLTEHRRRHARRGRVSAPRAADDLGIGGEFVE